MLGGTLWLSLRLRPHVRVLAASYDHFITLWQQALHHVACMSCMKEAPTNIKLASIKQMLGWMCSKKCHAFLVLLLALRQLGIELFAVFLRPAPFLHSIVVILTLMLSVVIPGLRSLWWPVCRFVRDVK